MATHDPTGRAFTGSPPVAHVLKYGDAPWLEALLQDWDALPEGTTTVYFYSHVHLDAWTDQRPLKDRFAEATYNFLADHWTKLDPTNPPLTAQREWPRFSVRKHNRITTEFTIPTVLADFLATQLGAPTGETTIADWGVCGYKLGDAQPLRTLKLVNIPKKWDEETIRQVFKQGFEIDLCRIEPCVDRRGNQLYNTWNTKHFNQWIVRTTSSVDVQSPYRLEEIPGGQALVFRFLPHQTLPTVMVDIPVTQGPGPPLTTGNQGGQPSYLDIAKGLVQVLENAQPIDPKKRKQPNPRTKKAQNRGKKENIPPQPTHPQRVTQPIQSHPPEGPKEPAGDEGIIQPQTDIPEEPAKDNPKETECTDTNSKETNHVSEQSTDNQDSILQIQDTPMEGQENEGGDKRSTEERSPSISQELSPTKKPKRNPAPPRRMVDYETGEAAA